MIEEAESETYYYHYDALGSVVALSDSSGDTVQTYEYSVYGQVAVEDINHPNPYMFAGRRFDIEIGLYYNRARYYNPFTGRFLQTDPIGYGAGMNLYAYCGNNSLNFVDPSGNYGISISIPSEIVWSNMSEGDFDTPEQHKADLDAYLNAAGLYDMFPGITLESVERDGYYYDAVFEVPDEFDISFGQREDYGVTVLWVTNSEGDYIPLVDERLAGLLICAVQSQGITFTSSGTIPKILEIAIDIYTTAANPTKGIDTIAKAIGVSIIGTAKFMQFSNEARDEMKYYKDYLTEDVNIYYRDFHKNWKKHFWTPPDPNDPNDH